MEDYKEKYEHGLECIQEILSGAGDSIKTSILRKRLQPFFSELKEIEDEEIRKDIRQCIKLCSFVPSNGTSKDEMFAWLEKQGEQKPTLPKWRYKNDNTPLLRDSIILNKYGCVSKSPSGALVRDVWVIDYDELVKLPKEESENQGEQKTISDIQKPTDIKIHQGDKNNPYDMSFEEAQDYITKRNFDICLNDCDVYVDDRYITQTIGNVLRWADSHPVHYDGKAYLYVLHKGVEQGKKEMLDRVIEWLDNNLCCYIGAQNFTIEHDRLNKDLRKAMEEQP